MSTEVGGGWGGGSESSIGDNTGENRAGTARRALAKGMLGKRAVLTWCTHAGEETKMR